jgi:hypothetical protein
MRMRSLGVEGKGADSQGKVEAGEFGQVVKWEVGGKWADAM